MTITEPAPEAVGIDERLVDAATGALELFTIHLGTRLGLYRAVADGAGTADELAERAGIHPRYAREWLEQQAVAQFLTITPGGRFALDPSVVGVFLDPTAPDHVSPLAGMVVGIGQALDEVEAAFRTGGGVPFARYGPYLREGQGAINRPAFTTALVDEWLPASSRAAEALARGGRVADLGCGQGWSAAAVAQAFPGTDVVGIDSDPASVEDAKAAHAGIANTRFVCAGADAIAEDGPFDVVLILEALHDMSQPVEVLDAARRGLAPDGVLIVADECVPDQLTPGDDLERMMYGWSVVHCLPASMAEPGSAALGTVLRESTVRELAAAAGFGTVEVLDVDGGFFRIYELRP